MCASSEHFRCQFCGRGVSDVSYGLTTESPLVLERTISRIGGHLSNAIDVKGKSFKHACIGSAVRRAFLRLLSE